MHREVSSNDYRYRSVLFISFAHTEKLRRRRISTETIEAAIRDGEMIEDYPNDPRGPSCLIYGTTREGRPIHVVCGTIQPDHMVIIWEQNHSPCIHATGSHRSDTRHTLSTAFLPRQGDQQLLLLFVR